MGRALEHGVHGYGHVCYAKNESLCVFVCALTQFLESYKSVTLNSMASSFDVTSDFLDHEIAELIVAGRINAKIDKVAGVIETSR